MEKGGRGKTLREKEGKNMGKGGKQGEKKMEKGGKRGEKAWKQK